MKHSPASEKFFDVGAGRCRGLRTLPRYREGCRRIGKPNGIEHRLAFRQRDAERTVEYVARSGGIHGFDLEAGHEPLALTVGQEYAALPQGEDHRANAARAQFCASLRGGYF